MRVYRIENDRGEGPYMGDSGRYGFNRETGSGWNDLVDGQRSPGPWSDGIKDFEGTHYFGFKSVWQLRKWFRKEARKILAANGMKCRVYEVDLKHVKLGKKQVAFRKDKARLVKVRNPLVHRLFK